MKYILLIATAFTFFFCDAQQGTIATTIGVNRNAQPFLPSNGVFGDGTDDYLEVQNNDGSNFLHSTSGDWSLAFWCKLPTVLSANEALFNTNETNTAVNNIRFLWDASPSGLYYLRVAVNNSAGTSIITGASYPIYVGSSNADRPNLYIGLTCDNTGVNQYDWRLYLNGAIVFRTLVSNSPGWAMPTTTSVTSLGFNFLMDRAIAGRFSDAKIFGARFWSRTLTPSEMYTDYNHGKWSEPNATNLVFDNRFTNRSGNDFVDNFDATKKITGVNFANIANNLFTPAIDNTHVRLVFTGNSLIAGSGVTTRFETAAYVTAELLNNPTLVCEHLDGGIGGQTTTEMISRFTSYDLFLRDDSKTKNIYIPFEITNDMILPTGALTNTQVYNNYVTLCQLARAQGFYVVAATILPRSSAIVISNRPTFEADRQVINQLIRDNYASFADAIADVGADTTIGEAGDETNATYYADLTHLNATGTRILADYFADAIFTLL